MSTPLPTVHFQDSVLSLESSRFTVRSLPITYIHTRPLHLLLCITIIYIPIQQIKQQQLYTQPQQQQQLHNQPANQIQQTSQSLPPAPALRKNVSWKVLQDSVRKKSLKNTSNITTTTTTTEGLLKQAAATQATLKNDSSNTTKSISYQVSINEDRVSSSAAPNEFQSQQQQQQLFTLIPPDQHNQSQSPQQFTSQYTQQSHDSYKYDMTNAPQIEGKKKKQVRSDPNNEVNSTIDSKTPLMQRILDCIKRKKKNTSQQGAAATQTGKEGSVGSLKSKLLLAGLAVTKEKVKVDKEADELNAAIKNMSPDRLLEKAWRHLIDGLLYRTVRHDLDKRSGESSSSSKTASGNARSDSTLIQESTDSIFMSQKFILIVWSIQNSGFWNDFLLFLGWVYIAMSFFEPSNRNDDSLPEDTFALLVALEIFILSLQTIDLAMEIMQRLRQSKGMNVFKVILQHKKNFFRCLFFLLNASDLIYYATSYPVNTFRFARVIRPLQIIIFSKQLRRNFQGIISSARNLLMILFFYILIICFWSYIGVNMLGDLYDDPELDTYAIDFRDFLKTSNALYVLSSLDLYPDIMFPAVTSSLAYLAYFLPYLKDRIKRRKALWACFQCIAKDRRKSFIGKDQFISFFSYVYGKYERKDEAYNLARILWSELDANENNKLSIEEFFNVLDLTEQRFEFRLQRIKAFDAWMELRDYMRDRFNLPTFLTGQIFQNISFVVTLCSCVITVIGLIVDDESQILDYTDYFDKTFFVFFILEIVLKFIGEGFYGFFQESWNIFDLILVLFSAFFDYIFSSITGGSSSNVKSVSATRVLKIAKLQKIFRMFRALRTVKILSFIFSGLEIIEKVYEMLYKIVICIPIVMRLSVICAIVLYIYAVIGVELFASNLYETVNGQIYGQNLCQPGTNSSNFNECEYANFDSFGNALLILIQVSVGSGWGYIQFEYAKKFDDFTASGAYFNSFHFISVFILALIGGLVWEVFDVVERIMRDKQAYDAQLEMQAEWEQQQQMLEGSFQSGSISSGIKKPSKPKEANQAPIRGGIARPSFVIALQKMKGPLFQQQNHDTLITEEDEQNQQNPNDPMKDSKNKSEQKEEESSEYEYSEEEESEGDGEVIRINSDQLKSNNIIKNIFVSNNFQGEIPVAEDIPPNRSMRQNLNASAYDTLPVNQHSQPEQILTDRQYTDNNNNNNNQYNPANQIGEKSIQSFIQKPLTISSATGTAIATEAGGMATISSPQKLIKLTKKSKKKKKKQKKSKPTNSDQKEDDEFEDNVIEDNNTQELEWQFYKDERNILQRDRAQLVLYQEKFKLFTEDGFHRARNQAEIARVYAVESETTGIINVSLSKQPQQQQSASQMLESVKKQGHQKVLSQIQEEDQQQQQQYDETQQSKPRVIKSIFNRILLGTDPNLDRQEQLIIPMNQIQEQPALKQQQIEKSNIIQASSEVNSEISSGLQLQQAKVSLPTKSIHSKTIVFNPAIAGQAAIGPTAFMASIFATNQQQEQQPDQDQDENFMEVKQELSSYDHSSILEGINSETQQQLSQPQQQLLQQQQQLSQLPRVLKSPRESFKSMIEGNESSNQLLLVSPRGNTSTIAYGGGGGVGHADHLSKSPMNAVSMTPINGVRNDASAHQELPVSNLSKSPRFFQSMNFLSGVLSPMAGSLCALPEIPIESDNNIDVHHDRQYLHPNIILENNHSTVITSPLPFFKATTAKRLLAEVQSQKEPLQLNKQLSKDASQSKESNVKHIALGGDADSSPREEFIITDRQTEMLMDISQPALTDMSPISFNRNSSIGQQQQFQIKRDAEFDETTSSVWSGFGANASVTAVVDAASKSKRRAARAAKNQQELLYYYKKGLLDVDVQSGSLSAQPIKSTLASIALSKSKSQQTADEYKSTQRVLILDAPGNKLLEQQISNINSNLRQIVPFQMMIDLSNMNYIINKAILKNVNQEKVEKVEIRQFRTMYGSQFEDMLDTNIFPMWQIQSKILFHFDNILKYDHIPTEDFIQLYCSLELQMSSLLMNKFSHMKILFQLGGTNSTSDEWFTINYLHDSYFCQSVGTTEGPWEFFDELFRDSDKERLYKHRNIYSYAESNKSITRKLKQFFTISQAISNNAHFRKLQLNQKRSDIVYIPFVNEQIEQTRKKTFDAMRLAVHSPNYIFENDLTQARIPYIKNALLVAHLTDNPIVKDRDRRLRYGGTMSIEHAIVEEELLEKEQARATFNYPYTIEFLKDIRNHIEMFKHKLFAKVAQFYHHRDCFDRNFANLTSVPFQ